MQSLNAFADAKLAALTAQSLRRTLKEDRRLDGLYIEREGKRLLSFSCNDYLNLTHHPAVKAAACAAIQEFGAGAGASRLVTGNHPLIEALEARIARWKGAEAACVFSSGYMANVGIVPSLAGLDDVILIDERAHACLWAGAQLSGAALRVVRHNDSDQVLEILKAERARYRRALLLTDGVFSMDGDLAPLDLLSAHCAAYDCWLMTDDAHGLGVVGGGRGAAYEFPGADVPLQMGTLSKAAGSLGGYLCASRAVIDLMKTRARTLIYSTGLPPASAAAALAALDIIEAEPERVAAPRRHAQRFTAALNLPAAQSAIVPFVIGQADRALLAARALEAEGFLAVPIRPPTVAEGTARLRFAFTALHPEAEIDRLAGAVRALAA
ncbi:MAG TPA: aminotransferase class I/II-fold pyridoxal phosphate-dependent enzyme [Caulobacterales bacterium]|nr:aminotransferase class I/II-fold pyridoxal phosphate-dependent enzyme [Caulobacterales bacterium]